jgi:hypothetical protein
MMRGQVRIVPLPILQHLIIYLVCGLFMCLVVFSNFLSILLGAE